MQIQFPKPTGWPDREHIHTRVHNPNEQLSKNTINTQRIDKRLSLFV